MERIIHFSYPKLNPVVILIFVKRKRPQGLQLATVEQLVGTVYLDIASALKGDGT